ncbi:anti-sigma regulatory factor [Bacillus horti]|uniref:Serine/threonine-protein kinase RsbT n=1 Tax=Caldalkalibacillus horti TaxID=77523 RepID=A0ABT9W553_9BACI|nr:anti-sigma regulatory factor [Bacillus horti]MDQ0168260.1 serine/threonine-protein kinase RsbT [Bacillus horti]
MSDQSSCVEVEAELDIVAARQSGRTMAKEMGFGEVDQARIATAISELARNIYLYAKKGVIIISIIQEGGRIGLRIQASDNGPGISDLQQVLQDGFTTSGGLGAGLPGVKRLMDTFEITSEVGNGTEIISIKWLR